MKNKTLKNLIATGIFMVSIFSVHSALAYSSYYNYPSYSTTYYGNSDLSIRQQINEQQYAYQQHQLQLDSQLAQQQYYNDQQKLIQEQNLAIQQQNLANISANTSNVQTAQPTTQTITYVPQQQTVQYVPQQQTVQYLPQQQTVQYVPQQTVNYLPASAQGASAYNSVASNKVINTNSGGYVSYDPNLQAASAYGYNNGQVASQTYDPNGVAALSLNGSGGFLPTSVFQWFMLILLILAIIIVARIIIRKSHTNDPHALPVH